MDKWDTRFIELADQIAAWSKDPSTQVGAVAVSSHTRAILATGYNGFPRGVPDDPSWLEDREQKYPRVVHAESNVICHAARHGSSLEGATRYVTHAACPDCAGKIINAGIAKVVSRKPDHDFLSRWGEKFEIAMGMFDSAGVSVDFVE